MRKLLTLWAMMALLLPMAANAQDCTSAIAVTSTAPFTESFDGGSMPACWTTDGPGTWSVAVGDYSSSTGTASGAGNAKITHGSTGDATKLVTPVLDLSGLTAAEMNFWQVRRAWGNDIDGLTVYYRLSATDPWVSLQSFTAAAPAWTETTIIVPATSATMQFAFEYTDHYGYGCGIDEVSIGAPPSCLPVTGLAVTGVTATSATIAWSDTQNDPSATYNLQILSGTDTTDGGIVSSPYTVTGLTPNTAYTFRVQADCGDSQSAWTRVQTHTTCAAVPASSLPWTEGFESYTGGTYASSAARFSAPCWSVLNRNDNYPYVSSSYANTGSKSLVFYCNTSSPTIVSLLPFESALNTLQVTFSMRSNDGATGLEVGVISNPSDPSSFTAVQTCIPTATNTWEEFEVTFPGITTTGNIAFRYVSNSSYNSVFLDDITVGEMPSCVRPSSVSASAITSTGATITIVDATNVGNYTLVVNGGDSTVVSGNTLTLDTLTPNTQYTVTVRTLCDDGTVTASRTCTFLTLCSAVEIPYTNGFETETASSVPSCWTRMSGIARAYNSSSNAHGGDMYLHFSGSLRNMIVLPPTDEEINTLQVRFWTRPENVSNSSCGTFEVGYITELSDTTTFTPMASWLYNEFTDYAEKEVSMATAPDGALIAFLHKPTSSSWYWYVDDVVVEPISACPRPNGVVVTGIDSYEATLNVADSNHYGNYHYTLYVNDTVVVADADFAGETYTVYGLTPNTDYRVDVAASCGGTYSNLVSATFRTSCIAISTTELPYNMDFDAVPTNTLPACWRSINLGGSYYQAYPQTTTTTNPDGTSGNGLQFYLEGGTQMEYAILPQVDDLSNLMLSFAVKGDTNVTLTVGVMDDPSDTATFTVVQSVASASNTEWVDREVRLDTYTGTGHYVAIRATTAASYRTVYIDNVSLLAAPGCARPQSLSVRSITTTTATLHIEDTSQLNNYNILLISGNDTVALSASDTVAYLTALTPSAFYRVEVSGNCSDGTVTASVATSFHTGCEVISVFPYTENFDTWAVGAAGASTCWNRLYVGYYSAQTNSHPYADATHSHSAGNSLRLLSSYEYDYYDDDEYVNYSVGFMPEFSTALSGLSLRFWYKAVPYSNSNINNMKLAVGISSSTADTSTFTRLMTITPADSTWHEYELELSAYTGTGTRITFLQYSESGYGYSDYGYIDDITVDQLGDCERPATVTVSNVDSLSAVITWTDINPAGNYSVRWSDNDSTVVTGVLTYTLNGLTPGMFYTVSVRRICDDGTMTEARTVSFQTSTVPVATLPYSTGFEATDDLTWEFINNAPNQWTIGSATANGGTQSLYISDNNGTDNSYTTGISCISFAVRNFVLDENEYALTFDWKGHGENNYDFLRVFVCHDSITPAASMIPTSNITTSVPAGWQDVVGGQLSMQGTAWQTANGTFTVTEAGIYKLVFMWRNDNTSGTNPPAAIDNVSLNALACASPANLVIDSVSATEATVSWTPVGTETAWLVALNGGAWQTVNAANHTFTGLTPATTYEVRLRALCSATDTSFAITGSFTTGCATITAANLPWTETFDNLFLSSGTTYCWERFTGLYVGNTANLVPSTNSWTATTNALGGSRHMRVNIFGTSTNKWLVTPTIDLSVPARLTFDYALTSYGNANPINTSYDLSDDRFMVLISADGGSSWTPLATWADSNYASIPHTGASADLSLGAYMGQTVRIAFYGESTVSGGDNDLHIDNVAIILDTVMPQVTYTVTLASADATMGTVSPDGVTVVAENASFTATATANVGYHFVGWNDATGAPVSTDNPYTFTVTENRSLTATFEADTIEPDLYVVTVNYDATRGTVLGAGTYVAGSTVTLTATSNPGYRFAGWSNGEVDSVYVFVIEESVILSANFEAIVGIDDVESAAISLYPNPARSTVTVEGMEEGSTVTIVDLNGREVLSSSNATLDISHLPQGAYFVRITGERQQVIRKLIVK